MDNVAISDMFLYLIMLNLLKENYVLHAHLPHKFVDKFNDHHVRFFGLVLCVDWNASYSSHVAYVPISGSYF